MIISWDCLIASSRNSKHLIKPSKMEFIGKIFETQNPRDARKSDLKL